MIFTQYYLDCLSQASYLIGDETTGKAVIVDPRRDVAEYVADAAAANLEIVLSIQTHFHADFLSGHLELTEATGAEIGFSSVAETEFDSRALADGERISLGEVTLEILHTPGHTPESISVLVYEHPGDEVPYGILTGDTLFIGDVGRPDLLASIGFTKDELARMLYNSVETKIKTLPDEVRVFPGHGAGSACGKNLSTEKQSTIGEQKATNYALNAPDEDTFVDLVTEGQSAAPAYFVHDAVLNRKDRELFRSDDAPPSMTLSELRSAQEAGAIAIDTRDPEDFAGGHLRGTVNVGLNGRYAEFAGSVVPADVEIVIVAEPGTEAESRLRLARIGFDNVIGALADSGTVMINNPDEVQRASRLTAVEFANAQASQPDLQVVDVRNPGDLDAGSVDGATNIPVTALPGRFEELDPAKPTVVYCAGGYRSSVAASFLREKGFVDVSDVIGGFGAMQLQPA